MSDTTLPGTEPETGTVSFTRMDEGTPEDYALLARHEARELAAFPDKVLGWLREMDTPTGYQVTRLGHSLQSATRAERAGEDEEMVLAALLHDIGDVLAPANHSQVAAAMLRPYVSERTWWIIQHHGAFQQHHYGAITGADPDARERWRGHEHFQACADFCADYDQVSFDPDYDTLPLSHFEPLVRRWLAAPRTAIT